jgi:hypothetical protein
MHPSPNYLIGPYQFPDSNMITFGGGTAMEPLPSDRAVNRAVLRTLSKSFGYESQIETFPVRPSHKIEW